MASKPPPPPRRRTSRREASRLTNQAGTSTSDTGETAQKSNLSTILIVVMLMVVFFLLFLLIVGLILSLTYSDSSNKNGQESTSVFEGNKSGSKQGGGGSGTDGQSNKGDAKGDGKKSGKGSDGGQSDAEGDKSKEGSKSDEHSSNEGKGNYEHDSSPHALQSGDAFGVKATGNRILYLLEHSSRTGRQQFATASTGLIKSLDSLNDKQKFLVILYANDYYPMFSSDTITLVPFTPQNKRRVQKWLEQRAKTYKTSDPNLEFATSKAMAFNPTTIFVVTSGGINDGTVKSITKKNAGKTVINVIGIAVKSGEKSLQNLAEQNDGVFLKVK